MQWTKKIIVAAAITFVSACSGDSVNPNGDAVTKTDTSEQTKLMGWGDLTSRPLPKPTIESEFGIGETDLMDIWMPDGYERSEGPFPVVLMIHGGCWQKSIADRKLMNYAAKALADEGMAVINIEYRGVDETGGGYPGTFTDVARAAAFIPKLAEEMNLDMKRVAGFGHSAGGHLITWLAGLQNLPKDNALRAAEPLPMVGVINSGGLADLEASEPQTLKSCLADIKDKLTGPATQARPDPLADTSSDHLLPSGGLVYSVNGERDKIAPPNLGEAFTRKARAAGDKAEVFVIPNEGHVELIAPGTAAFDKQIELLKSMLGISKRD